jgi:uncharacterized protein involved in exopolysaccharide biosynthesis
VNQIMQDRIQAMAQTVMSRTVLTTMIQSLDLYPKERSNMPMEDVVEKMRKNIVMGNVVSMSAVGTQQSKTVPAFVISFSYTDRFKAQKVVAELATKFIDQSIRDRGVSSQGTKGLLKDQWDAAKQEMEMYETRLAEFRTKNQGRLPDEIQSNLSQMNALQIQLSNLNGSISRVDQDKLALETQLRILKDQMATLKEPAVQEAALAKSDKLLDAEREVASQEKQLAALREHYKDTYPGVQNAIAQLAQAKAKRDQAAKEDAARKPEKQPATSTIAREQRDLDAQYKRVQGQIEAKDLEGAEYRRELEQVKNQLKSYQARIEGIPASEKQNAELIRDRDIAKAKYLDLDAKMTKSNLADEMEKRKFGESLEVLDPASTPQTPTDPKREIWVGLGVAVGLGLGLMLAAAREMKDTSLKNLKDVRAYTQLPILGSIPLLENDLVVKRRRRLAWLAWSIAGMAGVVMMSGSVVYYFVTRV